MVGVRLTLLFHRAVTQHKAHWAPRDKSTGLQLASYALPLGIVLSAQLLVGLRLATDNCAQSNCLCIMEIRARPLKRNVWALGDSVKGNLT